MDIQWHLLPNHDFETVRKTVRAYYNSIVGVVCPSLDNEEVIFNSRGFKHIVYKRRTQAEIIDRLFLLQYVAGVVGGPRTEASYNLAFEEDGGRTMTVHYWSIERRVGNSGVRVVIRQNAAGPKHFYSIMRCK